jgi:hypothetical protein
LIIVRDGAGSFRSGTASDTSPPARRRRYAPSLWLFQGGFPRRSRLAAPPPRSEVSSAALPAAEEIIVTTAFAGYISGCESADRACARRRCDAHPASSASCLPPRRVAAPGDAYRMNPKPSVFADATPIKETVRDAMNSNALGLLPHSSVPHSTASPARLLAAAAARLGVPPECQSACLSMPLTPRRLGLS